VSACAVYSLRKFSFCKIFTLFVGNLIYSLAHKNNPYAVCWKASKTFRTLISKLRRSNVIEVNHWAKVANITAHINVQNPGLCARHLTAFLHIKNRKYQTAYVAQQYIQT